MKEEILLKLKTAEVEVARRVSDAKKQATTRMAAAQRQASDLESKAQVDARRTAEEFLDGERARLEQERQRILGQGQAAQQALREHYAASADAAVDAAVKRFEDSIQ